MPCRKHVAFLLSVEEAATSSVHRAASAPGIIPVQPAAPAAAQELKIEASSFPKAHVSASQHDCNQMSDNGPAKGQAGDVSMSQLEPRLEQLGIQPAAAAGSAQEVEMLPSEHSSCAEQLSEQPGNTGGQMHSMHPAWLSADPGDANSTSCEAGAAKGVEMPIEGVEPIANAEQQDAELDPLVLVGDKQCCNSARDQPATLACAAESSMSGPNVAPEAEDLTHVPQARMQKATADIAVAIPIAQQLPGATSETMPEGNKEASALASTQCMRPRNISDIACKLCNPFRLKPRCLCVCKSCLLTAFIGFHEVP